MEMESYAVGCWVRRTYDPQKKMCPQRKNVTLRPTDGMVAERNTYHTWTDIRWKIFSPSANAECRDNQGLSPTHLSGVIG